MYDFTNYIDNKSALIQKMNFVEAKISELDKMGIDISESQKKIEAAKHIVENDKISVVLVGAFSDGKTSVIAGWINEKLDNMKIDSDESSDEILCYTPTTIPEGCQIVDTPGLFGDKIGADENGGRTLLSDITKKFISEANLILYVVTAKNPIKDSHKDCIRWILKDLNKLSSTIFVINRMDDVADLTDEDDFSLQTKIKTDNLRGKLLECGLTQDEANKVNVACISAAPNGQGIEIWNEHREEYLRRSHLSALENMTTSILKNSRENLITKTGCDILNDELTKTIELINEQEKQIEEIILPEKKESLQRNKKDLDALYDRLTQNKISMLNDLNALRKKKLNCIRATSVENYKAMLENEIGIIEGKEGYILSEEISSIYKGYTSKNANYIISIGEKIQAEYSKRDEAIKNHLKKCSSKASNGLKILGKTDQNTIKKGIFSLRDILDKMGKKIIFKPWQVTKMAAAISKALPIIGAAIDVISSVTDTVITEIQNKKFEETKNTLEEIIINAFCDISEELNSDDFYIQKFAPNYEILKEQIQKDEEDIMYQEALLAKFNAWNKEWKNANYSII